MSVYIVRNHTPKWFFEILSTSFWIIVFPTRFEKGYIFTRNILLMISNLIGIVSILTVILQQLDRWDIIYIRIPSFLYICL